MKNLGGRHQIPKFDEATAEKQDFIDTVMKVKFWRNMPAKNVFKEQVKKYFLFCGKMNTVTRK